MLPYSYHTRACMDVVWKTYSHTIKRWAGGERGTESMLQALFTFPDSIHTFRLFVKRNVFLRDGKKESLWDKFELEHLFGRTEHFTV